MIGSVGRAVKAVDCQALDPGSIPAWTVVAVDVSFCRMSYLFAERLSFCPRSPALINSDQIDDCLEPFPWVAHLISKVPPEELAHAPASNWSASTSSNAPESTYDIA